MCLISILCIILAVFSFVKFGFWVGIFSTITLIFLNGYLTKYVNPELYKSVRQKDRIHNGIANKEETQEYFNRGILMFGNCYFQTVNVLREYINEEFATDISQEELNNEISAFSLFLTLKSYDIGRRRAGYYQKEINDASEKAMSEIVNKEVQAILEEARQSCINYKDDRYLVQVEVEFLEILHEKSEQYILIWDNSRDSWKENITAVSNLFFELSCDLSMDNDARDEFEYFVANIFDSNCKMFQNY